MMREICGECDSPIKTEMTDLTSKRLQELRRIAEAATPGPWEAVALSTIRALLDERDKREKAEARAAKLEEALRLALKWVEILPPGEPLHKESKADVAAARAALSKENTNET